MVSTLEIALVLAIILILFGPKKIPVLVRAIRKLVKEHKRDDKKSSK